MKRIGVVGLGLKNPYTYVPILRNKGAEVVVVYDTFFALAEEFAGRFGCKVVYDIKDFPFDYVDGVIIESISKDHLFYAEEFIRRNIPCFIEKPLSNDSDSALSFIEKNKGKLWFSASPLRFSPLYNAMALDISRRNEKLNHIDVTVYHTMEHFLSNPEKTWHDRYSEGGGMMVDIGIHAIEILNLLKKGNITDLSYYFKNSYYKNSQSGDVHKLIIEYEDKTMANISLVCCTSHLDYKVECCSLNHYYANSNENPYLKGNYDAENAYGGFDATIDAFLNMINTQITPFDVGETIRNFELLKKIKEKTSI